MIAPDPEAVRVAVPVPGKVKDRLVESVPVPVNFSVAPLEIVIADVPAPVPNELLLEVLANLAAASVPAEITTGPVNVLAVLAIESSPLPIFVIPRAEPEMFVDDPIVKEPEVTLMEVVADNGILPTESVLSPAVFLIAPADEIPVPPTLKDDAREIVIPEELSKTSAAPELIVVAPSVADPSENAVLAVN